MQSDDPRTDGGNSSHPLYPLWLITLGSGLIAGSLAGVGGEFTYPALSKEPQYPASHDRLNSSERAVARAQVRFATKVAVGTNEAAAAYGLLGAALGVVLGLAGGLARGSRDPSLGSAAVGGVLGSMAGAGLSMVIVPLFFRFSNGTTSAPLLFLTHAAIFAGVGAAGGTGLGWAWGDRKRIVRCMLGGFVAALVGTVAVDIINVATSGISHLRASAGPDRPSACGASGSGHRRGHWGRVGWSSKSPSRVGVVLAQISTVLAEHDRGCWSRCHIDPAPEGCRESLAAPACVPLARALGWYWR